MFKNMERMNFDVLYKQGKLTRDGANWLKLALDPFSDVPVELAGYPDLDSSSSFIQKIKSSVEISAPAGSVGNWDCLVFKLPVGMASTNQMRPGDLNQGMENYDHATWGAAVDIQGINAWSADTGTTMNPFSSAAWAAANGAESTIGTFTPAPRHRLIAGGFEVNNTTSEIYRQGSVTVGSTPIAAGYPTVATLHDTNGAPWETMSILYDSFAKVPDTITLANVIPNAKTWEAKNGCYVPYRQTTLDNMPRELEVRGIEYGNVGLMLPTSDNQFVHRTVPQPYEGSFAYFTGLSQQSTLRLTAVEYYEIFPHAADSLISSSSPSAPYDAKALELYGRLIGMVPHGVPVTMNPSGEYFKLVLQRLAVLLKTASPFVTAYNPAIGAGVAAGGQLASTISAIVDSMLDKRSKQPIKTKQPNRNSLRNIPNRTPKSMPSGFSYKGK